MIVISAGNMVTFNTIVQRNRMVLNSLLEVVVVAALKIKDLEIVGNPLPQILPSKLLPTKVIKIIFNKFTTNHPNYSTVHKNLTNEMKHLTYFFHSSKKLKDDTVKILLKSFSKKSPRSILSSVILLKMIFSLLLINIPNYII